MLWGMAEPAIADETTFPRVGARARRWMRFERDYHAWLESPEGRFARWRAERQPQPIGVGDGRTGSSGLQDARR